MKRFTIVTRPYLLEDLQHATYEIFSLLENYLGGSGSSYSEPLDRIRLLSGSIDLDQGLRNDLFAVLARLEAVGLPRAGRAQIKGFRRIVEALLEWPEQVGGTKLWIPNRHLDWLIREPNLAVEICHPAFECYTVPIKKSPDMDTYWLATEPYWQAFSTPAFSNILFLQSSEFGNSDFIELRFGRQQLRARYQKMALHEPPLNFPDTPYHQNSELAGSFFKEVRLQDREGVSNAVSRDLIIAAQSDKEEFDRYQTVGWLNPLILGFDVAANDIPLSDGDVDDPIQETIAMYLDPTLLVHFEPHIELLDSHRLRLLERLSERQRAARATPSAIESLLWGADGSEPWKSFFLLDRLGGEFIIDNFGRTEKQFARPEHRENELRLAWKAPRECSRNHSWLHGHVLGYGNIEEAGADALPEEVLVPSDMPGFGSPQGFRRVELAGAGESLEPTVIDVIRAMPRTAHESVTRNVLENMLAFAAEFLEGVRTSSRGPPGALQQPYMGAGSYQLIDRDKLQFDEVSFLELFSAHYLAPASPIYAILPAVESKPARVDLVGSVANGRKEFFRRLFSATIEGDDDGEMWNQQRPQQDIVYRYGWWQEWFEMAFARPWSIELHFVSERDGFIVAKSILGRARLGRARIGGLYDVAYMRV